MLKLMACCIRPKCILHLLSRKFSKFTSLLYNLWNNRLTKNKRGNKSDLSKVCVRRHPHECHVFQLNRSSSINYAWISMVQTIKMHGNTWQRREEGSHQGGISVRSIDASCLKKERVKILVLSRNHCYCNTKYFIEG